MHVVLELKLTEPLTPNFTTELVNPNEQRRVHFEFYKYKDCGKYKLYIYDIVTTKDMIKNAWYSKFNTLEKKCIS